MERRMRWKPHVRCEAGEKPETTSKAYLSLFYTYASKLAGFPVDKLAIAGMNKNNSELHIDFFDYEPERMNKIIELAWKNFKFR